MVGLPGMPDVFQCPIDAWFQTYIFDELTLVTWEQLELAVSRTRSQDRVQSTT